MKAIYTAIGLDRTGFSPWVYTFDTFDAALAFMNEVDGKGDIAWDVVTTFPTTVADAVAQFREIMA